MIDELLWITDQASRWIDSTLATGLKGMSPNHRQRGEDLCGELMRVGLKECGQALRTMLRSMEDDQVEHFGDFIVILELTRESIEINRFEHPHA